MALEYLKKILMSGLNVNKKDTLEEELDSLGTGGGGSADAVKYTSQDLTEEQQMQARKNLGLYYKEGEETVIEWDGDITGKPEVVLSAAGQTMGANCYKVSDSVPSIETIIGAKYTATFKDGIKTIESEKVGRIDSNCYTISDTLGYIIIVGTAGDHAFAYPEYGIEGVVHIPENGIYLFSNFADYYVSSLVFGSETVHKIEEKYLPDSIARGKNYVFEGSDASWDELVAAATEFQDGRATIVWSGQHVLEAFAREDGVYIRFANDSYCVNKYTDDGSHLVTSYSPDQSGYDDVSAKKIRFRRDDTYDYVGSIIAKDDNTINVSGKFLFDSDSLIIRASDNYNKHFKITVNSQGVLSATEVTSEP